MLPRALSERASDAGEREVLLGRLATARGRDHVVDGERGLLGILGKAAVLAPAVGAVDNAALRM